MEKTKRTKHPLLYCMKVLKNSMLKLWDMNVRIALYTKGRRIHVTKNIAFF